MGKPPLFLLERGVINYARSSKTIMIAFEIIDPFNK